MRINRNYAQVDINMDTNSIYNRTLHCSKILIAGSNNQGVLVKDILEASDIGEITFLDMKILTPKTVPDDFLDCDLIIDCLKDYNSKFMLNKYAVKYNKTFIHCFASEQYGHVTTIDPKETPCLDCLFTLNSHKASDVITRSAQVIGALQAKEAVNILLKSDNNLKNILLAYNANDMDFKKIKLSRKIDCEVCSELKNIIKA